MPLRELSAELKKKTENQLNEDPNRTPEDIKHIQDWIDKQAFLNARKDEQWILAFLRGCEFSLSMTKTRLDSYYTMKTVVPEFWQNRDPMSPEIQETLDSGFYLPLLQTTSADSQRTFLLRFGAYNPKRPTFEYIKVIFMMHDIMTWEDDHVSIGGGEVIQDMKGLTPQHLVQWTPPTVKKFMTCVQNAHPTNPKGNYFINIPSYFETFFSLFETFLTENFKNNTKVFSTNHLSKLYDFVPKSILPKDYGGDELSIKELTAYWKKKVESYRDWFLEDEKYKTDESKRPGTPRSVNNVFGMEGSFRQLSVD